MMNDPYLTQAKSLIGAGKAAEARRLLHDYLGLYANNAEAWLLLAAVSAPQASLEYVQKAIALEPDNAIARRALKWAERRINPDKIDLELPAVAAAMPHLAPKAPSLAVPQPPTGDALTRHRLRAAAAPAVNLESGPPHPKVERGRVRLSPAKQNRKAATQPRDAKPGLRLASFISLISIIFCGLLVAAVFIFSNAVRADSSRALAANGGLAKASLTFTSTFTATATPTYTHTATSTPTYTHTPTLTYTSTETPLPTDTHTPTLTNTFTPSPTFTPTETFTPSATPVLPTRPAPTATSAPPVASNGRWIEVNLSNQTLTAWEGNTALNTFVVSTGKWSTQTLPGTFRIYVKLRIARMIGIDFDTPDVPYVMYYDGDFGIHGAYWHNSFGAPVSHGCVNMRVPDAAWLFSWASVGTLVKIHY